MKVYGIYLRKRGYFQIDISKTLEEAMERLEQGLAETKGDRSAVKSLTNFQWI
jgi:hypothetical protein